MSDIILYIGIIVVSGIVGSRVRAYRDKLGWTSTIQTMAIVLLVLLMGARMGANEEIIANLGTIGLASFVMTIAMMLGSLIFLLLARKALGFTKNAQIAALHSEELAETAMEEETEAVAVFYPLLAEVTETVGQAVIENQSAEIAVESENPHSAQAILDAVAACLEQAER